MPLDIQLDAFTRFNRTGTSDPDTVSHSGIAPDIVIMISIDTIGTTDHYVSFTYGGVAVPSVLTKVGVGNNRFWRVGLLLAADIPAGTQDAVFDYSAATTWDVDEMILTLTSGSDYPPIILQDSDSVTGNGTAPTLTMQAGGILCQTVMAMIGDRPDIADITKPGTTTSLATLDRGSSILHMNVQTTPSALDYSPSYAINFAANYEMVALTFREYFDTTILGDATVLEGNTGTTSITFPVIREPSELGTPATVDWAVTGTGANPCDADDFVGGVLPSGTLSFSADEVYKVITVDVVTDDVIEEDETFTVTLSNPSVGSITTATAIGTILNDDCEISIVATNATTQIEGDTNLAFNFNVIREGYLGGTSGVLWTVEGYGSFPAPETKFLGGVYPSGVITYSISATIGSIALTYLADDLNEPDYQFKVLLNSPAQGSTIRVDSVLCTVINEDAIRANAGGGGGGAGKSRAAPVDRATSDYWEAREKYLKMRINAVTNS